MAEITGTLTFVIVEAQLDRDTDNIGSMDVYVKAKWGEDGEFTTNVIEGAGK